MRRFFLGGVLGGLLGLGVGAAVARLLHVALSPLLGTLVAAAVGATVVGLVRRPPWRQRSAIESVLRITLGMVLGSGLQFLLRRFADVTLPLSLPPLGAGVHVPEHPMVLGVVVGAVLGLLFGIEPAPAKPPVKPEAGRGGDSGAAPAPGGSASAPTI